jgi:hypothetical protein
VVVAAGGAVVVAADGGIGVAAWVREPGSVANPTITVTTSSAVPSW